MGITIHYQGKAKSLQSIDELIATMRGFAINSKWQYPLIDEEMRGYFRPSWGHGYGYIPSKEEIQKRELKFFPKMQSCDHSGYFRLYDTPYAEEVRKAFQAGHYPRFSINTNIKGIQLEIHPQCEWLEFLFDLKTLDLADYERYNHTLGVIFGYNGLFCKTQFAGVKVHIIVCKLIKLAERYIDYSYIHDEGRYYETQDVELATKNFNQMSHALEFLGKMLKNIGEEKRFKVVMGREEK